MSSIFNSRLSRSKLSPKPPIPPTALQEDDIEEVIITRPKNHPLKKPEKPPKTPKRNNTLLSIPCSDSSDQDGEGKNEEEEEEEYLIGYCKNSAHLRVQPRLPYSRTTEKNKISLVSAKITSQLLSPQKNMVQRIRDSNVRLSPLRNEKRKFSELEEDKKKDDEEKEREKEKKVKGKEKEREKEKETETETEKKEEEERELEDEFADLLKSPITLLSDEEEDFGKWVNDLNSDSNTAPTKKQKLVLTVDDDDDDDQDDKIEEEEEEELKAPSDDKPEKMVVGREKKKARFTDDSDYEPDDDEESEEELENVEDEIEEYDDDDDFVKDKEGHKKYYSIFNMKFALSKSEKAELEEDVDGDPLTLSEDPLIQVPKRLNVKLHPYQREGVQFFYNLFKENNGGILGDDMGLGKTLQTIAFIIAILNNHANPASNDNNPDDKRSFMIITPASVMSQWKKEFSRWSLGCGRCKTEIYHGKINERERVIGAFSSGRADVLITSYETLRRDFDQLNSIKWTCVFLDEVHKIKDHKSQIATTCFSITTPRRYGLTGTVVMNNYKELWTLCDWAQQGCLGTLPEFRDRFINPIKNGQRRDATLVELAKSRSAARRLSKLILGPVILRREKSLIADMLPGKDDNIIFCPMTDLQQKVYNRAMQSEDCVLLRSLVDPCDCQKRFQPLPKGKCCYSKNSKGEPIKKLIFPIIQRLQHIANHLMLLKMSKDENQNSSFVKEVFGEDSEQIQKFYQNRHDIELSGKIKALKSLLPVWQKAKSKVLLFSSYTKTLDLLERFLKYGGYQFCRLDGSSPPEKRQLIMDQFNKNPRKFVFLISTKAGGLGLNLVSANIVVVFDPNWNQSHDLQAQDRAYRLGQKRFTKVFRLISANTIEERQYQYQIYKQQMAAIVMQNSHEKRYFKDQDLFGITNLLKTDTTSNTKDILQQTEEFYEGFRLQKTVLPADQQNALGDTKKDEDPNSSSTTGHSAPSDDIFTTLMEARNLPDEETDFDQVDDEMKILMGTMGTVYHHRNNDIIGNSEIEKKINELALKSQTTWSSGASGYDDDAHLSAPNYYNNPVGGPTPIMNMNMNMNMYPSQMNPNFLNVHPNSRTAMIPSSFLGRFKSNPMSPSPSLSPSPNPLHYFTPSLSPSPFPYSFLPPAVLAGQFNAGPVDSSGPTPFGNIKFHYVAPVHAPPSGSTRFPAEWEKYTPILDRIHNQIDSSSSFGSSSSATSTSLNSAPLESHNGAARTIQDLEKTYPVLKQFRSTSAPSSDIVPPPNPNSVSEPEKGPKS